MPAHSMRYVLSILILVTVPVKPSPLAGKDLQSVLIAQDDRDAKAINRYLTNDDADVRALAALACGSIQDTSSIDALCRLLEDDSKDVRLAAAFSLGQMNEVVDTTRRISLSKVLLKRLGLERNRPVLMRIVEALGKTGDEYSLNVLVASGMNFPTSALKCEAALSVGRYAYRGITSKTATAFAVDVLNGARNGDEWKAAYAVMRIGDSTLLARHAETMMKFVSHRNPHVRMFVAAALGKLAGSARVANALLSLVVSDPDWRVRVNATRAIAGVNPAFYSRLMPLMQKVFTDGNEHVSLTALAVLGDMRWGASRFREDVRTSLSAILTSNAHSPGQHKQAAIALAKTFGAAEFPFLMEQLTAGRLDSSAFIGALAYLPASASVTQLVAFAQDDHGRRRREALEALQVLVRSASKDSGFADQARPAFLGALRSADMAVIATAASAFADSTFSDDQAVILLTEAVQRMNSREDAEGMVAVIQALGSLQAKQAVAPLESTLNDSDKTVAAEAAKALKQITGKSYDRMLKFGAVPAHTNYDWPLLEWLKEHPDVRVRTSQGVFIFRMNPDDAPFTCLNFAVLIRRGFFKGLLFHRVVPNFVIQGGDPRGDGWGGPGYAIRSEFGYAHYQEGTVGVASSGKDTEGCQWFVTHCNTPHLDGRYTIFGRVTAGMDVVNKIQVGDRIEKMEFREPLPPSVK